MIKLFRSYYFTNVIIMSKEISLCKMVVFKKISLDFFSDYIHFIHCREMSRVELSKIV